MSLTLAMLRCPDDVAPETRTVAGGEFSIGRASDNDWVLPDPERALSKRHCVLAFRAGGWQVSDLSTNGTFLNREADPIGRGQTRELRSGDRLAFGAYEIEIHVDEEAALAPRRSVPTDPFAARRLAAPELFALDPFAAASDRDETGFASDPLLGGGAALDPFAAPLAPASVTLPADFDPLAPDPAERGFRGPTQPDHAPHLEDAFSPPVSRTVLPDDWDREMPPHEPVPVRAPEPAPIATPPVATAPAAPLSTPGHAPSQTVSAGGTAPPRPAAARAAAARMVVAPAAVPPVPASNDLLAAFLRGCGVDDLQPADPVAMMEALGAAFRAVVSGLRQAMIARSAVKGEFRIEQTIIRSRGNNPLKFSADDDDALAALLGVGRRPHLEPAEAIDEAMRDIRQHELVMVTAMQAAVRALLAEFEPSKLRQSAERGGLALLTAQRKANAWDAFEARHARVSQALVDDFDSVFGKAFARAYERAVAELSSKNVDPP
ncbi:MAG: type VI secretion system-associated FHA domain protein TagH [Alphaproteobacteria bacterium]